ncbi:helix-turn-helix domain-containing protein [Streptomyces sp. NBC_01216]|uniref:helix-turn-helix domain-containing protein n=1 Tax=Streptomyces sp. NBC_01216 TaxID=2903778 RepID=UPI002E159D97|nr:helix-turn-helix domain-containing protein [Streptomyces sp. NBC_01216]
MNTATAATQARVTVDTIRAWCRRGVISATKTAGRWIIDTASLARRIAIGAMRTATSRKALAGQGLDLTATITTPGYGEPRTITPRIKTRTDRRTGARIISIDYWVALLANKLATIPDAGDRAHAVNVFLTTTIVICDQYDADWDGDPQAREGGRLRTSYHGGHPLVSVDDVLDLAAQIRTQLAA